MVGIRHSGPGVLLGMALKTVVAEEMAQYSTRTSNIVLVTSFGALVDSSSYKIGSAFETLNSLTQSDRSAAQRGSSTQVWQEVPTSILSSAWRQVAILY